MSEKVAIEPQYILEFVGDLGLGAYAAYSFHADIEAGKDPMKKLGNIKKLKGKEREELRMMSTSVSTGIAQGLILAKQQPKLVTAFVEQMNLERPGYADKLLEDILWKYQHFLYQKHFKAE